MTGRISRLLTDRRVGTKIMFAVLVVAAASVVDGLTAMTSLGSINQQVKAGYQHSLGLETLGDLRSAVNRTWLAIGDSLLATDGAGRSTASDARATAENRVEELADEYQGYPLDAEAENALTAFRTAWEDYRRSAESTLLPLVGTAAPARINEVRAERIAPLMDTVRDRLSALTSLTVQATAGQEASAEDRYQDTKWWVLTMLVFSALLGVVLAIVATRLIVGPLSRCVTALERIRHGDLTARAQVDTRDEVGRMAQALNHTAEAMDAMVGRVRASADVLVSASQSLSTVSTDLSVSAEQTSRQVSTVSESAGRVSDGVQAVSAGAEQMGVSIREIAGSANEAAGVAAEAARTAAAAVEQQTATTAEIARSVGQAAEGSSAIAGAAQAAQQVTAGASETRQTATDLARTAAELQATVAVYRT